MSDTVPATSRRRGSGNRRPAGKPGLTLTLSPSDVLDRLFRFFISMRLGLVLLLVLAVLTLIGTMLMQVPAGVKSDPQAYAAWLDSARAKYGGWTDVIDKLGFFAVFSSYWFKGTMVLLCTSILACSVHRAPRLWQKAVHPRMIMTDAFFEQAPLGATFASSRAPEEEVEPLRAAFKAHRFRTTIAESGDTIHVCADRFRWGPFGRVLAHLSFVIILIGGLVGATWGFRNNDFAVPVGSTMEVGYDTGLSVEAKYFSDSYYANGAPSDYASKLVLYKDGTPVKTQMVRVNHPLRYDGVTFYQSFFGPAAQIRVQGAKGKVLFDQGVPLLWGSDDQRHRIGRFTLPGQALSVFVVGAASGLVDPAIAAGQMQLEVYKTGEDAPVATQVLSQGKPVQIAGLGFTFVREQQFTGLAVAHDPGSWLIWVGSTLLVIGMCVVFFFPHRRVRAVIRRTPDGSATTVAAQWRRDAAFEPEFRKLVGDIELAVTGTSTTKTKTSTTKTRR
jgi:cytochrome c biogenesis protein